MVLPDLIQNVERIERQKNYDHTRIGLLLSKLVDKGILSSEDVTSINETASALVTDESKSDYEDMLKKCDKMAQHAIDTCNELEKRLENRNAP